MITPVSFSQTRKNYIEIGELYFWTATINQWQRLLWEDSFKEIITDTLLYLSNNGKMNIYAFVIMPNHIHLILRTLELHGKETAQGSFLKHTAHEFKKKLDSKTLKNYEVKAANKSYEFWQRDSLAIQILSKKVALQKLTYIHNNPLAEHWKLAVEPQDCKFSSASFYLNGTNDFGFLKNILDEF